MLFQTSIARPATVAFVSICSSTRELMPLGTFNLYSVLEWCCLIAVQWMDLGLAYFRQVGANQLLRAFRAVFIACFFVSGLLILNSFLLCLFILNCFLSGFFFLDCFLSGFFLFYGLLLCQLFVFLFFLLFCHVFLDRDQIRLQIENLSLLSMDCLPQRLDLMFLGS